MEETAVPLVTEQDTPARRTDDVGSLFNTIVGSAENPPDPTAIPLLIDALKGEGREQEANDLAKWAVNVCLQYDDGYRHRIYAQHWSQMFVNDWGYLVFDLYSAANILGGRVQRSIEAAPEKTGTLTLNTVKVQVHGPAPRVGRRMQTSDGRDGVVVSVEPGGWVNLVLDDGPQEYENEAMGPLGTSSRFRG